MPTLYVVAGPNGCGKSTLTRTTWFSGVEVIDPDAIARGIAADRPGQAAREALRRMQAARREVYRIVLHYVSVDTPEQALDRICNRVALGGHDVPEPDVRRRFFRSLANLPTAIARSDEVFVYDNSNPDQPHREVAILREGAWWIAERVPGWAAQTLSRTVSWIP